MSTTTERSGFTWVNLFVVLVVAVVLVGLLMPVIQSAREAARQNTCTCHMHQMGIALQNYHDAYKRFPALSTEPYPQAPGSITKPVAGFSWLAMALPYMEAGEVYSGIAKTSGQFAAGIPAFSSAIVDANGRHYATYPQQLICPSFTGAPISKLSGMPPYASVPGQNLSASPPIGIAISNVVALSATDIGRMTGAAAGANGVIVPGTGVNRRSIKDGTSRTLVFCESREESLNSWLDGSVNWVVGANPNNAAAPVTDGKGFLIVPTGGTTALNVGPGNPLATTRYLTKADSPNGYEWAWGPSSQHAGGVVLHGYADAACRGQTDDIDATVYIQLITRAGGEPVIDPAVNAG